MKKLILTLASIVLFSVFAHAQYGGIINTVLGGTTNTYGIGGYSSIGEGCPATADSVYIGTITGISIDTAGDIFVYDDINCKVRKVDHGTGIIHTIAGTGILGYSGDGGPAIFAQLSGRNSMGSLRTDIAGNCYIYDAGNYRIRKINNSTGIITTVAGNGSDTISGNGGPATSAGISYLSDIFIDNLGNLFLAGYGQIRKVDHSTGIITVIAGTGGMGFSGDGGPATAAMFGGALYISGDNIGNIYVTDRVNFRVRKINSSGIITTIAGNGRGEYTGDCGPAINCGLGGPQSITIDGSGNIYILDNNDSGIYTYSYWFDAIRKIDVSTGIIKTVSGGVAATKQLLNDSFGYYYHVFGFPGDSTQFSIESNTNSIAIDRFSNLYIAMGSSVQEDVNPVSPMNTLSATDSLVTPLYTMPSILAVGLRGTISGVPASTDSVRVLINYRQFASDSWRYSMIPYWHSSSYGFGNYYNTLSNFTYDIPGIYIPEIYFFTLSGYSGKVDAPPILIRKNASSTITAITIDSAKDSIVSLPCVMPFRVRFSVYGSISGTPSIGDSICVVYSYSNRDTVHTVHIVPIYYSLGAYHFIDSSFNNYSYSSPTVEPQIMVVTSNGQFSKLTNWSSLDLNLDACSLSGYLYGSSLSDTSVHHISCSIPFTDKFSIGGTLRGWSDTFHTVKVNCNFGDGIDTNILAPVSTNGVGLFYFSAPSLLHTYTVAGNYRPTLHDTVGTYYDTAYYSVPTLTLGTSCYTVQGIFYIDSNLDCIHQSSERLLAYWPYAIVNNTVGDTITGWCDDSGRYSVDFIDGDTYTIIGNPTYYSWYGGYVVDSLTPSCPSSGIFTITSTTSTGVLQNFAFNCHNPTSIDMSVAGWSWGIVPGDTGIINVWATDYMGYICEPLSATVRLTLDPLLTYAGMWNGPTPAVSGHILTWTFATVHDLFEFTGNVKVITSTTLTVGDSVCNYLHVTPTSLPDPDLLNNSYYWCSPVRSSWDPNEKDVSPKGYGNAGNIANGTPLNYIIHFQNTGTAPARNISVIDTINTNLNISTLQIINSSAPVLVSQQPGNVIKFQFNNINLPDSGSNRLGSNGYVSYSIDPKPDLPNGTSIANTGYIYFDYNAAVITNTTTNTIDTGALSIESTIEKLNIEIYPNPAGNFITINSENKTEFNVIMFNIYGQQVLIEKNNIEKSVLDVRQLPSGVYFVKIYSNYDIKDAKIIIMH